MCYYPDLNFMISSSLDGTLKIGELERKGRKTRTLGEEATAGGPKKGIYSFTWSNASKVLASCGLERTVSLWNPYTRSSKPITVLQGHNASVQHVAINDDGYQLFSCSTDKCIKVCALRACRHPHSISSSRTTIATASARPRPPAAIPAALA